MIRMFSPREFRKPGFEIRLRSFCGSFVEICGDDESAQKLCKHMSETWLVKFPTLTIVLKVKLQSSELRPRIWAVIVNVTAPHSQVQMRSPRRCPGRARCSPRGRTGRPRQKSNSELFNRNNFDIHYRSWNFTVQGYGGLRHVVDTADLLEVQAKRTRTRLRFVSNKDA